MPSYISLIRKNHLEDVLKHIDDTEKAICSLSIYEDSDIRDLHFHYETMAECCIYLKHLRAAPKLDTLISSVSKKKLQNIPQDIPQDNS